MLPRDWISFLSVRVNTNNPINLLTKNILQVGHTYVKSLLVNCW